MSWIDIAISVLKALGGGGASTPPSVPPVVSTPPAGFSGITASGLNAFVAFAGPIVRIVEGKGTIADDEAALNAVLNAFAFIDPAAAPAVALIEDAEPFAVAFFGLVRSGNIKIAGGVPSWFPPGGGPDPIHHR